MTDNNEKSKCRYADKLLERYKNYKGRISASCDACKDKSCIHNHAHLEDDGFEGGYAFNIKFNFGEHPKKT